MSIQLAPQLDTGILEVTFHIPECDKEVPKSETPRAVDVFVLNVLLPTAGTYPKVILERFLVIRIKAKVHLSLVLERGIELAGVTLRHLNHNSVVFLLHHTT